MRLSSIAAGLAIAVLLAAPARAAEITFKLDDSTQATIIQLPAALDQCVAGMTMRADASICRSISQFLQSVVVELKNSQAEQARAPEPDAPAKMPFRPRPKK